MGNKNGAFTGTDVVSAQVSAGACPKEVPDVQPWIKSPAIPDEWRIIKPGENPKKDPDENQILFPESFLSNLKHRKTGWNGRP